MRFTVVSIVRSQWELGITSSDPTLSRFQYWPAVFFLWRTGCAKNMDPSLLMSRERLQIIDMRFERNFLQKRWAALEWGGGCPEGRYLSTSRPGTTFKFKMGTLFAWYFVEVIPKIRDILPKKQKYDFCTKFRPNPKNVTNYQKQKKNQAPKKYDGSTVWIHHIKGNDIKTAQFSLSCPCNIPNTPTFFTKKKK